MRHEIILSPQAIVDLSSLRANIRSAVRDAIELHLRHEPTKVSRSRIKRLRGLIQPQFRLRIGKIRVYYDVVAPRVEVLAIIPKARSEQWLRKAGKRDEGSTSV